MNALAPAFRRPRASAPLLLLCAALLLVVGCEGGGRRGPNASAENIWGIRALVLRGAERQQAANRYASALREVDQLDAQLVQVYDQAGETTLFYGRYQRDYDFATGQERFSPDPSRDLALIRQLALQTTRPDGRPETVWPFQFATLGALPVGGGAADPSWLLTNADGHYSLQVAVFYNTDEMQQRRFAAEEYCQVLREQGEQAYYLHGPVNSIVCIGAFPESAIQVHQEADPYTGRTIFKPKMADPRLLALQKRFPHHLHNGHKMYDVVYTEEGGRERVPHTTFAVEIPQRGESIENAPAPRQAPVGW